MQDSAGEIVNLTDVIDKCFIFPISRSKRIVIMNALLKAYELGMEDHEEIIKSVDASLESGRCGRKC